MKDGATKACVGMVMGVLVYAIYMFGNVMAGMPPPDGPLFIGLLAYLGSLTGAAYILPKLKTPS